MVSLDLLDMRDVQLRAELLKQRRRVRVLGAVVGLLVGLVRVSGSLLRHFGYFREQLGKALWDETVEWMAAFSRSGVDRDGGTVPGLAR